MAITICPKCGAESFETVEEKWDLQRMKCFTCGHEESVLVHRISAEERRATIEASKRMVAFLVWDKGRPTAAEIVNSRHIARVLRDKPISELRALFSDSSRYKLGEYFVWEIDAMEEKAKGLGMSIERRS